MQLQVQRLSPNAKLPTRATEGSAGYDLYAALDKPISIPAGAIRRIPTGLAIAPDRTMWHCCLWLVLVSQQNMALQWSMELAW